MDKTKAIFCSCGCNEGVVIRADPDDEPNGITILSLVSARFYTEQHGFLRRFWEKLKRIWFIIRNKEYCYFEICINHDELEDFKRFVNEL